MNEKTKQRIEKIAKRLGSYYIYECDRFPDRKKATMREFQKRAPADIEFLLDLIVSLRPKLDIKIFYK